MYCQSVARIRVLDRCVSLITTSLPNFIKKTINILSQYFQRIGYFLILLLLLRTCSSFEFDSNVFLFLWCYSLVMFCYSIYLEDLSFNCSELLSWRLCFDWSASSWWFDLSYLISFYFTYEELSSVSPLEFFSEVCISGFVESVEEKLEGKSKSSSDSSSLSIWDF